MLLVASIFLAFIIILMIQEINDKNKNIKKEINPENVAIEKMVQESLLNEKQKIKKNKSHSVRHRNNLFNDDFDNDFDDELTNPAYSNIAGNIFYHEP